VQHRVRGPAESHLRDHNSRIFFVEGKPIDAGTRSGGIAARDAEAGRAAVLLILGRRRTGEAEVVARQAGRASDGGALC